jgi:hypothetical protein
MQAPQEVFYERRTAFNAGEISPWTDPRIDQDKYHLGCRQMRNVRPTIYGGAFKRGGTVVLGEAFTNDSKIRLVTVQVDADKSFVVELTNLRMRVWATGGSPGLVLDPDQPGLALVVETPWQSESLNEIQFCQQNDLIYATHQDSAVRVIARYEDDDWRVVKYNPAWPALLPENVTDITLTCNLIGVTVVSWVNSVKYQAGNVVLHNGRYFACILKNCIKIQPAVHKNWKRWWIQKTANNDLGVGNLILLTASREIFKAGHGDTKWILTYRRDNLQRVLHLNGGNVGKTSAEIYCLGGWSASLIATSSGSGDWDVEVVVQRSEDLVYWFTHKVVKGSIGEVQRILTGTEDEPCYLRLALMGRNGAIPAQYKAELEVTDRDQHGIVRIKDLMSETQATAVIEFPVPGGQSTYYWKEPAWSEARGYPRAVTLHEGRLWFGGTRFQSTNFWATAPDRFEDFRIGDEANRGLEFQIQSDESSPIQWLVSHDGLIIGTKSSEWFYGQRLGEDLPKLRKSSSYGSTEVQARVVDQAVVFVQQSKRKLRELAWDGAQFASTDLTLLAEHFGDAQFVQISVQRNPETVVWIITDQGDLIGMTYDRGQNVTGWFRYQTGGDFGGGGTVGKYESVAVVRGAGEDDEIWVAVQRVINGQTKRFVERFQPDSIRKTKSGDQADLVFSDCSVVYNGVPTKVITGLNHLNGAKVFILANGAPHPMQVVVGGQVTIQTAASKAIVGLPYYAFLEPTYLETADPGSITKAFLKRITRVNIEFWKTLGCEISADNGKTWQVLEFRSVGDKMDEVPRLWSGIKQVSVSGGSDQQATIIIRSVQPLPMNVLSLVLRFSMGTA